MEKKARYLILSLLLLASAGFLALSMEETQPVAKPDKTSATSGKASALINKHLWQANHLKEQAEKRVEAQNSYMAPRLGDSIWPTSQDRSKGYSVDHSPDRNENRVYQDLNRDRKEYRSTDPDHIIQSQIHDDERMREYEMSYRQEYARQFVQNARRNGYDVRLNSDLVVISVKRIPGFQRREPSESNSDLGPQAQ